MYICRYYNKGRGVITWLNYVQEEKQQRRRKFKVYPSAYANMYASAVCSGKVTPGGKKKRKKAMGGGVMDMTRMRYLKRRTSIMAENDFQDYSNKVI